MSYTVISEMKQIAKDYGASLEVEEHSSGDYIDCVINKNNIDLYVVATRFNGDYLAYSLTSSHLPREVYPDNIKNADFTEKDRNKEILQNVELLLSGRKIFHSKPSFFNKKRGYITLSVDGLESKIFQKSNSMGLKIEV